MWLFNRVVCIKSLERYNHQMLEYEEILQLFSQPFILQMENVTPKEAGAVICSELAISSHHGKARTQVTWLFLNLGIFSY